MRALTHAAAAALALAASGCGDRSAVSLVATLGEASLEVEQLTLGTRLAGGFVLSLSLGPTAPEPVTVTVESFSLVRASDGTTLIAPLPAVAMNAASPIPVAVGENLPVTFVLDDMDLRPAADIDAVCAEPVQIVGAIRDSLSENPTTVQTTDISVGGCP